MCIFCSIIESKIPSKKVYENDDFIVIEDVSPQAKVHLLGIPKEHYEDITKLDDSKSIVVGKLIMKLGEIAQEIGLDNGFRIVSNKGEHGCQSVGHLHIHLLGGEQLSNKMC